jgi:hypothetical protein
LDALLRGLQAASIHGFLSASPPAKPPQKGDAEMDKPTPATAYADNTDDAKKRAIYGLGECGGPDASELQITSTRLLEEAGAEQ